MKPFLRLPLVVCAFGTLALVAMQAQSDAVPQDLKPLLAKPASEMRLVVTRYNADRQTLNANYAGAGGFNMPGGAAAADAAAQAAPRGGAAARRCRSRRASRAPEALRPRLAGGTRQAPDRETVAGRASRDLAALKTAIAAEPRRSSRRTTSSSRRWRRRCRSRRQLVALIEARIRVDDVDAAERGAHADGRQRTDLPRAMAAPPVKMNAATATRAAEATDDAAHRDHRVVQLLQRLRPDVHVVDGDAVQAGRQGAAGLRGVPARARRRTPAVAVAPASVPPLQPAPAPKFASVPDLAEIIALPQDEMRDIVARFNAEGGRGGGRRARRRRRRRAGARRTPRRAAAAGAARQPRLARRAEVARLRRAVAQRAGRLPLHQVARRDRHRARDRDDPAGPAVPRRRRRGSRASRAAARASSPTCATT